jgi:hypothetical protein
MQTGELLTRWTVRVAMALYVTSLATRLYFPKGSRLAWTAGCLAYLLHIACAFEFYHHWSHAEAYAFTARQTATAVGWDWGGGLYVNYAFTLVWLADVGWWWISVESYRARSRWIGWAVQGFMGFIAFNATVVFAAGFSRWFGIGACVLLGTTSLQAMLARR